MSLNASKFALWQWFRVLSYLEILIEVGESAKSLNRPAVARLQAMVNGREVQTVMGAKLSRLTRSVKDLAK